MAGRSRPNWSHLGRRSTSGDLDDLVQNGSNSRTTISTIGLGTSPNTVKSSAANVMSGSDDDDDEWADVPTVYFNKDQERDPLDERVYEVTHDFDFKNASGSKSTKTNSKLVGRDDKSKGFRKDSRLSNDEEEEELEAQPDRGYSRLQASDLYQEDHVDQGTQYLFDDSKAMTPLSQMQATKDLLTENQRIAYVSLCRLTIKFYVQSLKRARFKELKSAVDSAELWSMKIMARIYQHMEISKDEQRMIELLSEHGITTDDLVPSLMGSSVVANPEYDPSADNADVMGISDLSLGTKQSEKTGASEETASRDHVDATSLSSELDRDEIVDPHDTVSTSLPPNDASLTIDLRWTILCDLFLTLIADSVYDARSRVFLEKMAEHLGLTWVDVAKFERRVTEALEIEEGVETLRQKDVITTRDKAGRNRRYMMMGLATLGGGLIIGLSAGLLAPVIGAGLGAAFGTIGITGTTSFLAGTGGAAIITTGAAVTGGHIGASGMRRRTKAVRTFEFIPLYNARRVNLIITINGWMVGDNDDVRLPWSVIDPIMGDVFSIFWEPEMSKEMGGALKILTSEVTTQLAQQILQATILPVLMSSLQLPIMLTKLGYLVDNPWSNALDRAKAAGLLLADVLVRRSLGVRPIVLIGYSLGARAIFYALIELARTKSFGIVQDVFLFGSCVTASQSGWRSAASVVSGRFVNGFARNDWLLGYLFRATTGGLSTVAGLAPVEHVPGLDNVELSHIVTGHFSYRHFIPLLLKEVGFKVTSDTFDDFLDEKAEKDRDNKMAKKLKKEMKALEKAAKKQRKQLEKEGKIAPDGTVPDFELAKAAAAGEQAKRDPSELSTAGPGIIDPTPPSIDEGLVADGPDRDDDAADDETTSPPSPIDEANRDDGVHYDLEKIKQTLQDSNKAIGQMGERDQHKVTSDNPSQMTLAAGFPDSDIVPMGLRDSTLSKLPNMQRALSDSERNGTNVSGVSSPPVWAHHRGLSEGEPALSFWSSEGEPYQALSASQAEEAHPFFDGRSIDNSSRTSLRSDPHPLDPAQQDRDLANFYHDLRAKSPSLPAPTREYETSYFRGTTHTSKVDLDNNPWG